MKTHTKLIIAGTTIGVVVAGALIAKNSEMDLMPIFFATRFSSV